MHNSNSIHSGNEFSASPRSMAAKGWSLVSAFLVCSALSAHAATNVVTVCDQATLKSAVASGGTIQFGCDGTIVLTNTLVISQDTVIDGAGHNITISGNNSVRVFQVNPGIAFKLANLTVANGWVGTNASQPQFTGDAKGAGIYNDGGAVTLLKVTFSTNQVCGANGASSGGHGMGGAIYQPGGSLVGTDCTFVGNKAEGNFFSVKSGFGAGIFNQSGSVILTDSTFANNTVFGGDNGSGITGDGYGGGIYTTNGQVTLFNCQFSNNLATIQTNPAAVRNTGGYASGGAIYQESGTLDLVGSLFATNKVVALWSARYSTTPGDGNGGAIFNNGTLNSTNCSFLGNLAQGGNMGTAGDGFGGAIYNGGVANLVRATIAGNQCIGGRGSAVDVPSGYYPSGNGNGGGIYNTNTVLMLESTVSGNVAAGGDGPFQFLVVGDGGEAFGGAIHNRGVFIGTNNTVTGNIASGGPGGMIGMPGEPLYKVGPGGNGYGGGIFNNTNGAMTLTHLTLANNSAIGGVGDANTMGVGVGGGIVSSNGTVSLYNSIVANSTSGTNCVGNAIVDGGGNISSDASVSFSAPGSHTNMNPMLGALGYYGGPTQTIPLLPGSPAIDTGIAAFCPPTDQRGVVRAFAGGCDIGAFEVVPLFTISGKVTGVQGATVTAGSNVGVPDASGNYVIANLPGQTYLVTPSKPGFVFVPSTRLLALDANTSDVNFTGYRGNALTLESWTGNTMGFAFAGTSGQSVEIESSSDLVNWVGVSTNTIPASRVFQFTVTNDMADGPKYWRAVRRQ